MNKLAKALRTSILALSLGFGCGKLEKELNLSPRNDKCYSEPTILSYSGISINGVDNEKNRIIAGAAVDVISIQTPEVIDNTERITFLPGGELDNDTLSAYYYTDKCIVARDNLPIPINTNKGYFYWSVISHELKHGRTAVIGKKFIDEWVSIAGGEEIYGEDKQMPQNSYPRKGFLTRYSQSSLEEDISEYGGRIEFLYLSGRNLESLISPDQLIADDRYKRKIELLIKGKYVKEDILNIVTYMHRKSMEISIPDLDSTHNLFKHF